MKLPPGLKLPPGYKVDRRGRIVSAAAKESQKDRLVRRFTDAWRRLGGPELQAEHVFLPPRKFRLDFAHVKARVAVEIHGGTHSGGRHVRGVGFGTDRTKMNLGLWRGWAVFEFCDEHLRDPAIDANLRMVIETIQARGYGC